MLQEFSFRAMTHMDNNLIHSDQTLKNGQEWLISHNYGCRKQ